MTKSVAIHICREQTGRDPYVMPRGGSCTEGFYGYIQAFSELMDQGVADNVSDIVLACGSSGSTVALATACYLACGYDIRSVIYLS